MKASSLMLLLSLTLISCGKSGGGGKSTTSIPLKEGESLQTYLATLSLDPLAPQGVGTLLSLKTDIYNQSSIGLCTWFLVGPTKAMTNSHCVPQQLKDNKSLNCSKLMQGKIQTESGAKLVSCKKLIFSSVLTEIVSNNNDYALMEIDGPIENTETFNLKRNGVTEGETLSVLSMTHLQSASGVYSQFKKHNCLMKSSDYFGIISSAGASPVTGFLEEGSSGVCKTVSGNSGSPVVNTNGELIGILHGGLKENYDGSNGVTKNLSIITNLRCQKFGDWQMDREYPASCPQEKRINGLDKEVQAKKMMSLKEEMVRKLISKQPAFLEYTIHEEVSANGTILSIDPVCVKKLNDWSVKDARTISVYDGVKFANATIVQYELSFSSKMDYYGNMMINSKTVGMVEFKIKDLNMLGLEKINMDTVYSSGRVMSSFSKKVGVCE